MIFNQLFEPVSSTYTYLLGCEKTGQAMLIDPVINSIDRHLHVLQSLGLTLAYTLDTHIHADHITAALHLKERVGSQIAAPTIDRLPCVDVGIVEGTPFQLGGITLDPLHTPRSHRPPPRVSLQRAPVQRRRIDDRRLRPHRLPERRRRGPLPERHGEDVRAVRRGAGLSGARLPEPPGVVYRPGEEPQPAPRHGRALEEFKAIMGRLDLPYPKFIDYAVTGNRRCDVCPDNLPEQMREYCERMAESLQG